MSRAEGDSTAVRTGLAEAKVRRAINPANAGRRMPNMVSKSKEVRYQQKEFEGWNLPSGGSITRSIEWSGHSLWSVQITEGKEGKTGRQENDGQMTYSVGVNIRVNH
jgi:hypothetical protein